MNFSIDKSTRKVIFQIEFFFHPHQIIFEIVFSKKKIKICTRQTDIFTLSTLLSLFSFSKAAFITKQLGVFSTIQSKRQRTNRVGEKFSFTSRGTYVSVRRWPSPALPSYFDIVLPNLNNTYKICRKKKTEWKKNDEEKEKLMLNM